MLVVCLGSLLVALVLARKSLGPDPFDCSVVTPVSSLQVSGNRLVVVHIKGVDNFGRCLQSVKPDDSVCSRLNFDAVDVAYPCNLHILLTISVAPVPLGECFVPPSGAIFQLQFPLLVECIVILGVPGPPKRPVLVGDAIKSSWFK